MKAKITDLWVFYNKVQTTSARVFCTCWPGCTYEDLGNQELRLTPTLRLQYELEFIDKLWKNWVEWTFVEIVQADAEGKVSLKGTLLSHLRDRDPDGVTVLAKEGSLLV